MATIKGIKELTVKLDKISNIDLEPILHKACLVVENEAKTNCPVDTGQLRNSITHEIDGTTGIIGTNVEYSAWVEHGTGLFAVDGNGRQTTWKYKTADGQWHTTSGQKPQPYLQPALENNKSSIIKILEDGVKEVLDKQC